MFFFNLFRPSKPPSTSFVKYKTSATSYHGKTRKWRTSSGKERGTIAMIKKRGGLKALAQARPGDRIVITKKHIYKERHGKWTLFHKPGKGVGAAIRRFFGTLPYPEQPQNAEDGIEVRVVRRKIPRAQKIIKQIQKTNPKLADQIDAKQRSLEPLLRENQRLEQTERIARVKLSGLIDQKARELRQLCVAAKAEIASKAIIEPVLTENVHLIGKGAVKQVFVKEGEKKRKTRSVYYVAKQGLIERVTGRGSAEIKEEVSIAQKVSSNLLRKNVFGLFQTQFSKANASILTHLLTERFPTIEAVEIAIHIYGVKEFAFEIGIEEVGASKRMLLLLKNNINTLKGLGNNLAIDLEEVSAEERVKGRVTVRASQAEADDLEKRIRKKSVTMKERLEYVQGAFEAFKQIHDAGHVHGDIKPENMLIYLEKDEVTGEEKEVVKLADFGKVREHAPKETSIYRGNPRFASPERRLSMQGEVYSAAMVAIRILEEAVLDPISEMIISPDELDDIKPKAGRRGIEKFAVVDKHMLQTESTLQGRIKGVVPAIPFLPPDQNAAQEAMHGYINRLVRKLISNQNVDPSVAVHLGSLLKEMTLSIPESRPSMTQVVKRYNKLTSSLVK